MRILLSLLLGSVVAIGTPALTSAPKGTTAPRIELNAKGNVSRFYGVPLNLSIQGLRHLPYRVTIGHEYAEGDKYTTATIEADDVIQVKVSFGSDRKLSNAGTSSPNAVGPKGIGVGSLLSEVRAAWSAGRLQYGVEEGQAAVAFITGTNVIYLFDPKDMPPGTFLNRGSVKKVPDIRVRSISVSDGSISVPDACVPGYCL
jgi:hypothetical protein